MTSHDHSTGHASTAGTLSIQANAGPDDLSAPLEAPGDVHERVGGSMGKKTWFVTGAVRGMGTDVAKARRRRT